MLTRHIRHALAEKCFSTGFKTPSYPPQHKAVTKQWFMDVDFHGKHTLYIQEYKGTIKRKMAVITLFQIFSQFKDEFTLRKILLLLILDFFLTLKCCVQWCSRVYGWTREQVCMKMCDHGGLRLL